MFLVVACTLIFCGMYLFIFFFDEFFYNILVAGVLKLLLISMMFCFPFISCMKSIFVEL